MVARVSLYHLSKPTKLVMELNLPKKAAKGTAVRKDLFREALRKKRWRHNKAACVYDIFMHVYIYT